MEELEEKIGCGQAEELIHQAEDELFLIPIMLGMNRNGYYKNQKQKHGQNLYERDIQYILKLILFT